MGDPRYQHPMGVANQRFDWLVVVVVACSDGSTTIQIIAFFRHFEHYLGARLHPLLSGSRGYGSDSGLFALLVVVEFVNRAGATAGDELTSRFHRRSKC